jgi:DNA-binding IclR family transcriptional regulator
VYGRGSQIVVAKVDSPGGMGFSVRVGAELDLLPSISGRVLLAFQDEEIRAFRIAEALQRKPEHADPQIAGVLDFIRARGFEAAPSVQVRGLYAISFPVLASQGRAIAALTVPYAERIDQSQRKSISEVQDVLRDAAALLTSRVAGQLKQSAPRLEATKTKRRAR